MHKLVSRSISIIEAEQVTNGAYIASPYYPTYRYCWFRDGTFIAYSMDLWKRHQSAEHFYEWATQRIVERASPIERCVTAIKQGYPPNPADLLHTRYTVDGQSENDDWPNFQLDGFGTLLWGMQHHMDVTGQTTMPPLWATAVNLLIQYLAALWKTPNYDCWEEFPDNIAVSTLAALHAGLHAVATGTASGEYDRLLAATTAAQIKSYVLTNGIQGGHLVKQIEGKDEVDASLLWASVPFGEHGLLQATNSLMQATVARIETDLIGGTGGVHRYCTDTFYGGGEWILLTALLGEYKASIGDITTAHHYRTYIERHADKNGYLPEQISEAALHPDHIAEWVDRWGPIANPLLWSHAAYLSLCALLEKEV